MKYTLNTIIRTADDEESIKEDRKTLKQQEQALSVLTDICKKGKQT